MNDRAALVYAVVLFVMGVLLAIPVLAALRLGEIRDPDKKRNQTIHRAAQPAYYWSVIAAGLALLALIFVSTVVIIGGVLGHWARII
ncbi:hypothetical protein [Brevundimonas sp.]|uniref:hypothetical protein n=1 Tax=Brevundimonas sp. TaxID=1871086 RepID=UPI003A956E2A